MEKVIVGENQHMLLPNGHIIFCKDLKEGDELFTYTDKKIDTTRIKSIREVDKPIEKFFSAQGKRLHCSIHTVFKGGWSRSMTLFKTTPDVCFYERPYRSRSKENYVQSLHYLPIFGETTITKLDKQCLIKSLFPRSSTVYLRKQRIVRDMPLFLSKLTYRTLRELLFHVTYITNLSEQAKDFLTYILGRLGRRYNGRREGAASGELSATLNLIRNLDKRELKGEYLMPQGEVNEKAYEIKVNSETLAVGSIICSTI